MFVASFLLPDSHLYLAENGGAGLPRGVGCADLVLPECCDGVDRDGESGFVTVKGRCSIYTFPSRSL